MRTLYVLILLLTSFSLFSQDCEKLFSEDKFTKDKKAYFFIEGVENYKPFIQLTVEVSGNKSYSDENISIVLAAGTGKTNTFGLKDYSSLTLKYVGNEKNNMLLYFLFDDGKSFYLTGSSNVVYDNSVYFNKKANSELLSSIKTRKLTDIRFSFNDIQGDYKIPAVNKELSSSNQDFFMNIIKCINW